MVGKALLQCFPDYASYYIYLIREPTLDIHKPEVKMLSIRGNGFRFWSLHHTSYE